MMVPNILIVETSNYPHISRMLLSGASQVLKAADADFDSVSVPGATEIPTAIHFAVKSGGHGGRKYDGFIALGCVIRGETYHFEIEAMQTVRVLMEMGANNGLCIGNGILTVDNEAQALSRADPEQQNKGGLAASTCLAMIDLRYRMGSRREL